MASVKQHVGKSVANLARGAEQAKVVAPGKHGAAAVESSMDGSREARADRFQAATERETIAGLDDQVGVVALEREVDDSKISALAGGREGLLDLAYQRGAPQGRKAGPQSPGDEAGEATPERFPTAVEDGRPGAGRAAGAGTQPSPACRRPQVHGELTTSLLHDREHELAV